MLVQDFLINSAERFPDKTALVCGEVRYTYAGLFDLSLRLSGALQSMGLQRGDRVVIFCDNSGESVVSLFAAMMAGGIFVMPNPAMKSRKLANILNNSGARILIAHASRAGVVKEALMEAPRIEHLVIVGDKPSSPSADPGRASVRLWAEALDGRRPPGNPTGSRGIDVDLAAIIYTSGSTGDPKGVMAAHYNMVAITRSIAGYLENSREDIILTPLSLSYGYGLYQVLTAFMCGATVVLEPSFAFPMRVFQKMAKERATGFPLVPTIAASLLQLADSCKFDVPSLRYLTNAAAALPVPHIRRLMELFPQARIFSMYGLTECQRVAYLPPAELARRPDSVGIPIPNCEVLIVDEKGREVEPDQVGELVVRGAGVMQGYWRSPDESARRFRNGDYRSDARLYTGDLFRRDKEGFLYFFSRKDDMIKTKGERVSPKEIEDIVCEVDGVAEAAAVGIPDDTLGQAIKVFVVCKPGRNLLPGEVIRHCRKHLEPIMVPRDVEFRDQLPKTPNGKVAKKLLI